MGRKVVYPYKVPIYVERGKNPQSLMEKIFAGIEPILPDWENISMLDSFISMYYDIEERLCSDNMYRYYLKSKSLTDTEPDHWTMLWVASVNDLTEIVIDDI